MTRAGGSRTHKKRPSPYSVIYTQKAYQFRLVCPSVPKEPHWLPPDPFQLDLTMDAFIKKCYENPNIVEIVQNSRALKRKTQKFLYCWQQHDNCSSKTFYKESTVAFPCQHPKAWYCWQLRAVNNTRGIQCRVFVATMIMRKQHNIM